MTTFKQLKDLQGFIERANERHNGKYNYSKVRFEQRNPGLTFQGKKGRKLAEYNGNQKIIIICPKHGEFIQTARKHIEKNPSGCPKCAVEKRTKILIKKDRTYNYRATNKHKINSNTISIFYQPSGEKENEIIISKEDEDILELGNWRTTGHQKSRRGRTLYAIASSNPELVKLGYNVTVLKIHRLIMSRMLGRALDSSELIDHIDGNGLNNTRENLRLATRTQNHANSVKQRTNGRGKTPSSKYKGVCCDKTTGFYHSSINSSIHFSQKKKNLGLFKLEEDAARAYDREAIRTWGLYSLTNFPKEDYKNIVYIQDGNNERTQDGFYILSSVYGFHEILIDKDDWKRVKNFKWRFTKFRNNPYKDIPIPCIQTTKKNRTLTFLHNFIMNPSKEEKVIYINGNVYDNRKSNLKLVPKWKGR